MGRSGDGRRNILWDGLILNYSVRSLYPLTNSYTMSCRRFQKELGLLVGFRDFLSYFFVKKIPLSRRVEYVMDGSMHQSVSE